MPIYEYKCAKCEHQFEQLVKSMDTSAAVVCPQCGGKKVEKLLSVFAARQGQPAPSPAAGPGCGSCGEAGACPFRQ
jgi:putative FmdB family regulatory protein